MGWNILLAVILFFSATSQGFSQNNDSSSESLGDVAKKNEVAKKEGAVGKDKPKRVFTDDDMSLRKSPIPSIALRGVENTDEILAAIHEYRAHHTPEETEQTVHDWFDDQSVTLSGAIDANLRMQNHNQMRWESAQDRGSYPQYFDGDYTKLNEKQTTERWSQRVDARSSQENFQVISRMQQVLMKVRVDVICRPNKIKPAAYDWFKIRTANGIGSY